MPIPFTKVVSNLPSTTPFVGPETLERQRGKPFLARIGANESALGISPHALNAMQQSVATCSWYADPESYDLRKVLASKHKVSMDEICVDAGIDTLLGLTVRMLVEQDGKAVTSLGAYPTFNYHVVGYGAQLITVPYKHYHEDPDALLGAALKQKASLIYLSNPDNPMGTWHSAEVLQSMIDAIPENTVLALDEAYIEFAEDDIAPAIDTSKPNVIRYRTFSKAYGMAGLRIAYAIAHPDIVRGFNKVRNHFGINRLAQIGALASIEDHAFIEHVSERAASGRQRIMNLAAELGLYAEPSSTNFVAIDLEHVERASDMIARLADLGVFMRMPGVAPLNRCVRVGLGNDKEFDVFSSAFKRAL